MVLQSEVLPVKESDAEIQEALKEAFVPCLLAALAQTLGDTRYIPDELRPNAIDDRVAALFDTTGGFTPEQTEKGRALAFEGIKELKRQQEAGTLKAYVHDAAHEEIVKKGLDWLTGGRTSEDYLPLMIEELAPYGEDPRAPKWRAAGASASQEPAVAKPSDQLGVVIIGAGMSGILAAIRCKQAGIPFVVLEKNSDVGGTWLENVYPGARVDSTNLFYSYTFAQKLNWPKLWSPQPTLLEYFADVADKFGIKKYIRFKQEVVESTWDEKELVWRVSTKGGETWTTKSLIVAVGQLNRPQIPAIKGADKFKGPKFHTATWDKSVDLTGKKVLVIGTGSSASQMVPEVAEIASHVTVFQRTRNWTFDNPAYHMDISDGQKYLYAHVPSYSSWHRFWQFLNISDGLLPGVAVDEGWNDPTGRSCGELNKIVGDAVWGMMEAFVKEKRPDLVDKIRPNYPIGTKRVVLETRAWLGCLMRENVELVDGHTIEEITEKGLLVRDPQGKVTEYEGDAILYGTGFYASRFLYPMRFKGIGGKDLHESWGGDARAYLGITVPGFPNFTMMYGPNTNIVVNGSIVFFSECEIGHIMQLLQQVLDPSSPHYGGAFQPKRDVYDAYQKFVDDGNAKRAWGRPGSTVSSWYKNEFGRVAQNWPGNCLEYWQRTREVNPADYEFTDKK
ncbi:4-hydroxyacetophenone monooxygenase [Hyaloraphidium curvatum]|nr:4-hydroxyacetophenone monooxygenase [Hyaloraphidium curvatum]